MEQQFILTDRIKNQSGTNEPFIYEIIIIDYVQVIIRQSSRHYLNPAPIYPRSSFQLIFASLIKINFNIVRVYISLLKSKIIIFRVLEQIKFKKPKKNSEETEFLKIFKSVRHLDEWR